MRALVFLICLGLSQTLIGTPSVRAEAVASPPQSLFLGDRTCSDNAISCTFPDLLISGRFLHVIVHDQSENDDWQVQMSPVCNANMQIVAGAVPTLENGFLESVVDLQPMLAAYGTPLYCLVFRGRNTYDVTYYAAYIDDNPAPDAPTVYPAYETQHGRPDLSDLDVAFIHQTPSYAYDATPNKPKPGQAVTYTAHIVNAGAQPAGLFRYTWLIDNVAMRTGAFTSHLAVEQSTDLPVRWTWQPGPHTIELRLDPVDEEMSATNNDLTIRTDALSLGFWVEQSAYDYFATNQWLYCSQLSCTGSDSFGDWLQREVAAWNGVLAGSSYDGIDPAGIADRVRVDRITIVPDGALPLHGGSPTNMPDQSDHTVDLEWGLPAAGVANTYRHQWDGPFNLDWALLHELGHARYLTDMYRFDIPVRAGNTVDVTGADGRPAYDTAQPFSPNSRLDAFVSGDKQDFIYRNQEQDLMDCTCQHLYSPYNAMVLNRIRGRRAVCGNLNAPCNLGAWFPEIPPVNRISVLQPDGSPAPAGSSLRLFFDGSRTYNDHTFTQSDSATLPLQGGQTQLPDDPFHAGGDPWIMGRNLLLLEVTGPSSDMYCFTEPTVFNEAYWLGYRDTAHPATYTLRIGAQSNNACGLALPPTIVNEPFATSPQASLVTFEKPRRSGGAIVRTVHIALLDDAVPPNPMTNRQVTVRAAKTHSTGTTDARGNLTVTIPASAASISIDDVTDNNLRFTRDVSPIQPRPA